MDIERHVQAIQSDLAAAAALGDEAAAAAGERLAAAVGVLAPAPPLRRPHRGDARAQRPAAVGARRGAARRPQPRARRRRRRRAGPSRPRRRPGDDLSARITLRLPETLKSQVEAASNREGVSTNAWIVRALSRALEPRARPRPPRQPSSGLHPELEKGAPMSLHPTFFGSVDLPDPSTTPALPAAAPTACASSAGRSRTPGPRP